MSKPKAVTPLSGYPPGYQGNVLISIDYPNGLQTSVQSKLSQLLQSLQGKHEGWSFALKATAADFLGYIPCGISCHQDENVQSKDTNPNYPPPTKPAFIFEVSYFAAIPPPSSEAPDPVKKACSDVYYYLSQTYKQCQILQNRTIVRMNCY